MIKLNFLYIGEDEDFTDLNKLKVKLTNLNIQFEFEIQKSLTDSIQSNFDGVRYAESFQKSAFVNHLNKVTEFVSRIGVVDFIYKKNKTWWPTLIMRDALHLAIIHKHNNLSTRERALIIGTDTISKIAFDVLVLMGFKSFTIVGHSQDSAQSFVSEAKNKYFSLDFEAITSDKVILLPGVHSIVINTWNLSDQTDLLTDLLYFNYLKGKGLIVHFYSDLIDDSLLTEAVAIQEKVISRQDLLLFAEIVAIRNLVDIPESKLKTILS